MAARSLLRQAARRMTVTAEPCGMNFNFNEDALALQDLARKFAREEMIPKAAEYDQTMEYPQEIFAKAWELGLGKLISKDSKTLIFHFSQRSRRPRLWWTWFGLP